MSKPSVFVGSSTESLDVAHAVQHILSSDSSIDADVTIWNQEHFSAGATTFEALMSVLNQTDFAIMVVTSDDTVQAPSRSRVRDNVLLEAGMFIGRLGLERTFLLADERSFRTATALSGMRIATFNREAAGGNLVKALTPACHEIRRAMNSQITEREPAQNFQSCFISYSATDSRFAERLFRDLQDVGVRCWLDSKNLKIGDRWQVEIDRAISSHDKILLILSESSINSPWVRREIEVVLEREAQSSKTMLLPLRIDDAVMHSSDGSLQRLVHARQISDFRQWDDSRAYQRAFSRLARDLAVLAAAETESADNA